METALPTCIGSAPDGCSTRLSPQSHNDAILESPHPPNSHILKRSWLSGLSYVDASALAAVEQVVE